MPAIIAAWKEENKVQWVERAMVEVNSVEWPVAATQLNASLLKLPLEHEHRHLSKRAGATAGRQASVTILSFGWRASTRALIG